MKKSNSVLSLVRWGDWSESKLPYALWAASIAFTNRRGHLYELLELIVYIVLVSSFGYMFNDYCDIEPDQIAGKTSPLSKFPPNLQLVILSIPLIGMIMIMYHMVGCTFFWMLVGIIGSVFYSGGGLRLKEKGVPGVILAAFLQWSLPSIVVASYCNIWNELLGFIVVGFFAGCRWMLIHQRLDYKHDKLSNLSTFGVRVGIKKIDMTIRLLLIIETTIIVFFLVNHFFAGRAIFSGIMLLGLFLSLLSKCKSRSSWDLDFSHVSLSSFYMILGPIITYLFLLPKTILFAVFHLFLIKNSLIGEFFRYVDKNKGDYR